LSDSEDTIIDAAGHDTVRSSLNVDLRKYPAIEDIEFVGIDDISAYGNAQNNRITGNSGDNILNGGDGVDTLSGGAGSDAFEIERNGVGGLADLVLDFESGVDLLVIDMASFGVDVVRLGLASSGMVATGSFVKGAGAQALDANDFFVFDTARGQLYFDPDGSGPQAGIELARFVGTPDLQASDLYVVV